MTQPWATEEAPADLVSGGGAVTLIEGSTFCISDATGEMRPDRVHGLFVRDTRVLSCWKLKVDGQSPQPLTVEYTDPYSARYLSRVPPKPGRADSTVLVELRRHVGDGMREDLTVRNLVDESTTVEIELQVNTDFADMFEVKEGRAGDHLAQFRAEGDVVALLDGTRRLIVRNGDARLTTDSLRWTAVLPARGRWTTCIEFVPEFDGVPATLRHPCGSEIEHAVPAQRLRRWRSSGPIMETDNRNLAVLLGRTVTDLGSLRIFDPRHPERAVVAAGAPWFMALFGRDSLLTSWMVLPLDVSLALGTLETLAELQGNENSAATEEQPGRILHEVRFGPASSQALGPAGIYYGTADATGLFVMLLGELLRWGAPLERIKALIPHADRALRWLSELGDRDGDGFVEYERATPSGLLNQGWKDSFDGINFADGTMPSAPIALCEVQAYSYGAYLARADLAVALGDDVAAQEWRTRASALKRAFNDRFWMPERHAFAIGLDGDKRQIDSIASNMGHCLWTGIVDDDKARAVADWLISPEMFSGWGIRTLASNMGAYNPMSYHNGSIWPHDNAICVAGLMRYGFAEHAQQVTLALFGAAAHFGGRLPELFCGFERSEFEAPVPYPTSCSPQAWAAAAPLLLVRSLLRFDPDVPNRTVEWAPALPPALKPLTIGGLRLGDNSIALSVDSGTTCIEGLPADFRVVGEQPG